MNKTIVKKRKTKKTVTGATEGKIVRLIHRTLNSEKQLKWYDNYSSLTSVSSSLSIFDVTGLITQNVKYNQRIGASILAKSLRISGSWVTGDVTQLCRIVVFKWLVSNSVDVPSTGELFNSTGADQTISGFLEYKPSRFKILSDQLWHLDSVAHPIRHFTYRVPINSKVEYDDGVNTGRNHIYMCYVSDSGAVPHPTINFSTQLSFLDTE